MKRCLVASISVCLTLASPQFAAVTSAPPFGIPAFADASPAAAPGPKIIVTEGTPVNIEFETELRSGSSKVGDEVIAETTDDIFDATGKVLLIRKGAQARGKVTVSKKAGAFGKAGKLEFTIDTVRAVDGTLVPLRGQQSKSGKSNATAVVAVAVLLTPLALFGKGHNSDVHPLDKAVVFVSGDTSVCPTASP